MISRSSLKLSHLGSKLGHLAKSAEKLVNTLAVTLLKQSSWILLKMFVLMISRSSLKLGHFGSKTRWPGQISRKLLTFQRSHFLNNHHKYCSKCLSWWFLGLVWNWVTWYQKLVHLAKSKENLVDALEVTFFKWSSWILLKMFVLMISRWFVVFCPVTLKFFHLGQFLSNYWSYRVIFGTCEVFVFRSVSQ